MKVLLVSDTHYNTTFLQDVVNRALSEHEIGAIFHLGDHFEDPLNIERGDTYVYRVPGIYHVGYKSGALEGLLSVDCEDFSVLLCHSLQDVTAQKKVLFDVILYGHTHAAAIDFKPHVVFVNPGHLKGYYDRGNPASYAILEFEKNVLSIDIYKYGGGMLHSLSLQKDDEQLYEL
ncbi:MAG: metallophosphoesterase family protein [Fibrobacterota bacterium]